MLASCVMIHGLSDSTGKSVRRCSEVLRREVNQCAFISRNTLFFYSLGFRCTSVSGVRAGYYFIVMKGKRCRWKHQKTTQNKLSHEDAAEIQTKEKENCVLALAIVGFEGQWWIQEAKWELLWWWMMARDQGFFQYAFFKARHCRWIG